MIVGCCLLLFVVQCGGTAFSWLQAKGMLTWFNCCSIIESASRTSSMFVSMFLPLFDVYLCVYVTFGSRFFTNVEKGMFNIYLFLVVVIGCLFDFLRVSILPF